jgi:hypothetical protein
MLRRIVQIGRGFVTRQVLVSALIVILALDICGADRAPIPDAASQEAALAEFDAKLGASANEADRDAALIAYARRLLSQKSEPRADAALYVAMTRAQAAAARAGDLRVALDAENCLAKQFQVPEAEVRNANIAVLSSAIRSGRGAADITALTTLEILLEYGESAAAAGDFKQAVGVAQVCQGVQQTKDPLLPARIRSLAKQSEAAQRQRSSFDAAEAKLRSSPDDASASVVIGRYLCFVANNWSEGLRHLAKSNEAPVRAVAKKELFLLEQTANPSADASRDLADAWWAISKQSSKSVPAEGARSRAAYWYAEAFQSGTDLLRVAVAPRIKELHQTLRAAPLMLRNFELDDSFIACTVDDSSLPDELELTTGPREIRISGVKRTDLVTLRDHRIAHCGKAVFVHVLPGADGGSFGGALGITVPREDDGTNYHILLLDRSGHIKHFDVPLSVGKLYSWETIVSSRSVRMAVTENGKEVGSAEWPRDQVRGFGFGCNVRYRGNKSDLRLSLD